MSQELRENGTRRMVWILFVVPAVLVTAWHIRHALLIIYVSAVFAAVLKPGVDWLHGKSLFGWHPGRGMALLLIIVLVSAVLGVLLAFALPALVSNVAEFVSSVPRRFAALQQRMRSIPLLKSIDVSGLPSEVASAAGKVLPTLGGATADILTGLLLVAYFILDGAGLLKRVLTVLPRERRLRLESALNRATRRMRHWLRGQAMLMVILGASAAATFGFMGLPYFYLLAILAAVANIVPLLGPLVTVVVAGAVAASQSAWDALGVLIFYLVYQQVENAYLTPSIMKSQVQLPSPVVIAALLIGGELAGIAGVLVAVPSAVLIAEIAAEYLLVPDQVDTSVLHGRAGRM